jgi:hypothetical protein
MDWTLLLRVISLFLITLYNADAHNTHAHSAPLKD